MSWFDGNSISASIDFVVGRIVLEATPPKVVVLETCLCGIFVVSRGGKAKLGLFGVVLIGLGGRGVGFHVKTGLVLLRVVDVNGLRVVVV